MLDGTSIRRHTGGFTCRKVTFSLCTVFAWVIFVFSAQMNQMSRTPRDISRAEGREATDQGVRRAVA